ncbi:MAG: TolC family protein [Flavobacterium sp.]|nr:MAG: TolC family protein [Flavobacterium sp.]
MKKILLLALFVSIGASAQEVLTFADCQQRAFANNLRLKSADYQERAAVYEHRATFGKFLPNIYAEGENRNSWGKEIDSDTNLYVRDNLRNTEGTLNAYFNLFSGFEVYNNIKIKKQQLEIDKANLQQVRNEISISLAQHFITILYLQEIIEANEEQIRSSAKQVEIGELKFNEGVISESELFKIKSQKASEELRLLNSKNMLADNMIAIKQLMNIPVDQEITLMQPELQLDPQVAAVDSDPYALAAEAARQHPMYKMSLFEQQKAKAELSLARAPLLPKVTLRLMYRSNYSSTDEEIPFSTQLDENTTKSIRFYITVPIFSQFDNYGKIKSSKMRYLQSKVETKMEENRLTREVLKAINDAKTSLKKTESTNLAFDYSKKSYDADALKFELGKININELNTTKIMYNTTQAELIQAKYELLFNNALIRFYMGEDFNL